MYSLLGVYHFCSLRKHKENMEVEGHLCIPSPVVYFLQSNIGKSITFYRVT